jgi:hypothetical protein
MIRTLGLSALYLVAVLLSAQIVQPVLAATESLPCVQGRLRWEFKQEALRHRYFTSVD